ncbi:MAG: cation diffusion facilitator family transporter [bacterium]|nr:cation diffusion facilitator family transporter [bacterium]
MKHDCLSGYCARDMSRYRAVLGITLGIALLEIVGGIWSGSLALLSDAGHVAGDGLATVISIVVYVAVHRQSSEGESAIRARGAYILGGLFLITAGWILYESSQRFREDVQIATPMMLVVAMVGFLGNCWQMGVMSGGIKNITNLTLERHFWTDAIQSVGVIVTGLTIWLTGWTSIDAVCSTIIALVIAFYGLATIKSARAMTDLSS